MKNLMTIVATLVLGSAAQAAVQVPSLSCSIIEAATQGGPAIETKTVTQEMKLLADGTMSPGGYFADLKYTTQDGLFQIEAQGIKVANNPNPAPNTVVVDYLPVWVKSLKTGVSISASGVGDLNSKGNPNNDYTSLNGQFPTSMNVNCQIK